MYSFLFLTCSLLLQFYFFYVSDKQYLNIDIPAKQAYNNKTLCFYLLFYLSTKRKKTSLNTRFKIFQRLYFVFVTVFVHRQLNTDFLIVYKRCAKLKCIIERLVLFFPIFLFGHSNVHFFSVLTHSRLVLIRMS